MSDGPDPGFVDWRLAERVAVAIAELGAPTKTIPPTEVGECARPAADLVAGYTGLRPAQPLPEPETVDRAEWVRANLAAVHAMGSEAEARLADSASLPEPLRRLSQGVIGAASGAQLGAVVGYLGRRVLGQYDVALIGPARPPRLLLVGPNIAEAHARLGGERRRLVSWIALHEATHALQFAAVPWLRPHIGGLVEELLGAASLEAGATDLREVLGRLLPPPDPRRLLRELEQGGLVRLLAGPEQARLLHEIQAAMTVVEGYAEHVMDAVGSKLDPGYERLRAALEERRDRRSALDAVLARLLGLDMKLRQYRIGKRFADAVAARAGIEGLNAVWDRPEALPSSAELERPELWMRRVGTD